MNILLLSSCKEELTAEHTNLHDPASESYTPIPPQAYYYLVYDDSIVIKWIDNSYNEDGYIVSKQLPFGSMYDLDTVYAPIGDSTAAYNYSYSDIFKPEPLNNRNTYIYEVSAFRSKNRSKPAIFFVSPSTANPSKISISHVSPSYCILSWNYTMGSEYSRLSTIGSIIERRIYNSNLLPYEVLDTLSRSEQKYHDMKLDTTNAYEYRLSTYTKYYRSNNYLRVNIGYRNKRWSLLSFRTVFLFLLNFSPNSFI